MRETRLTKAQRKHVNDIREKLLDMLQTPVSQPYSSSDSSSVIILGKPPSSQKKNSATEQKSVAGGENQSAEKKSIMSIGSFGEELNKLRVHLAEREKREKEGRGEGESGGGGDSNVGGGDGKEKGGSVVADSELLKAVKDVMNAGVAGPSTGAPPPAHHDNDKENNDHAQQKMKENGTAKGSKEQRECEQKSESNKNSNKKSIGSKNETCSCPSDAEP